VLSSRGLARIASVEPDQFQFIIGSRQYSCCRSIAAFLSDHVCKLLCTDPTATQYSLDQPFGDPTAFESLIELAMKGSIELVKSNFDHLRSLAKTLGNAELDGILTESILSDDSVNDSNVLDRLHIKSDHHLDISDEIAFIAPRFSILASSNELDVEQVEIVLSHPDLVLESEDWLLSFILNKGSDYSVLLRYVKCQYLSNDGIENFINAVTPDLIDGMLWPSICDRLRIPHSGFATPRLLTEWIPFIGNEFDGIISMLTRRHGNNVNKAGVVEITSSSQERGEAHQLVDYSWRGEWYTHNATNSWVCFQFKTGRVKINSYTIRSFPGTSWPKNWVIEISEDNVNWTEIDRREDTNVLCGNLVSHHFDCQNSSTKICQYVRMRNIGVTYATNHYLCLCNIEFFGTFLKNSI
jgi:hypothetical protein